VSQAQSVVRLEGQLHSAVGAQGGVAQAPSHLAIRVSVAPLRNSKGDLGGHIAVISDARQQARLSEESSSAIAGLQKRQSELEKALSESQTEQTRLKALLDEAHETIAEAKSVQFTGDEGLAEAYERLSADAARLRNSSQQLLEINRLKSEFIVNAGREIEASLQSLLGFVALLEQGSYGPLTREQSEAVASLHAWAKRMKIDVDALIDYGSTRSRRLDANTPV
jgi:signal transduction histidine kinase